MPDLPGDRPQPPASRLSPDKYARLRAEAAAPYRGLRKFIYGAVGASGGIGAFVFLTQALAGRDLGTALPNLALQVGVLAAAIWLFRWEQRAGDRALSRQLQREQERSAGGRGAGDRPRP
jgi:hypothetical protein